MNNMIMNIFNPGPFNFPPEEDELNLDFNPRLTKLFFVTRLKQQGGLLQPPP